MSRQTPGFFERITGARVLGRDSEEAIVYEEDPQEEIEMTSSEEEVEEALEEPEQEEDEDYSDENTSEAELDEQEGQLTVDVFQDDTNIIVQSTVAGVSPDDLDVSITNDMITIRGQRHHTYKVDPADYFYQECYWGTFSRSIILPVEIDSDRAEAKIKNGILTIRIPKANTAMTRKLEVTVS